MAEKYEIPEEGASMSTEYSSKKNRKANVPGSGLYRHPESGQEAIVQSDPLWGNTQAQAFARLGFKFVREATADEVKTLPELAMDSRKADEGNLKGLSARLDALEDANAKSDEALKQKTEENKNLAAEVAELREKLAAAEKAEKASAKADAKDAKTEAKNESAAADHITEAGKTQVSNAQEQSAERAKESAEKQTEVREQATGSTNTNVTKKDGK